MTATATALQRIAAEARSHFELGKRDDGSRYWRLREYSPEWPEWLVGLIRDAHQGETLMFPDDWRYEAIVEALDAYEESEEPDDVEPEADVYTSDLKRWLSSHGGREDYCDRALEEGIVEASSGLVAILAAGQYMELREVYDSVRRSLEARIEEVSEESID